MAVCRPRPQKGMRKGKNGYVSPAMARAPGGEEAAANESQNDGASDEETTPKDSADC